MASKKAAKELVTYRVEVAIAGREGTQREIGTNKRLAIRRAQGLIKGQPFGSASSVTMERNDSGKGTLIFQAHIAKHRNGAEYVRSDEL